MPPLQRFAQDSLEKNILTTQKNLDHLLARLK